MTITDLLKQFGPALEQWGFFAMMKRAVGWWLVSVLKTICDFMETIVDKSYDFLDFTTYAGLDKVFGSKSNVKIILGLLLAFALLYLGYNLIINKEDTKPKVMQNLIIMVAVVTLIPTAFSMLNTVTVAGRDYILGSDKSSTVSDKVISNSITDWIYIDKKGIDNYKCDDGVVNGKSDSYKINNFRNGKEENAINIDVDELIDDDTDTNSEMFQNELKADNGGNLNAEEIEEEGFLFDVTEWYYRYKINFVSIFITLAAFAIAYFFVAYKTIRIIFELVVNGCLAYLFAGADLTTGKKSKMILQNILSSYVVLFVINLMLKIFLLANGFINENISNSLLQGLFTLFIAIAVIDGPNIVERALGIDAGLRSGLAAAAVIGMGAKVGITGAKAGLKGAKGIVNATAGAMGKKGAFSSRLNNWQSKNTNNSDSTVNNNENSNRNSDINNNDKSDNNSESNINNNENGRNNSEIHNSDAINNAEKSGISDNGNINDSPSNELNDAVFESSENSLSKLNGDTVDLGSNNKSSDITDDNSKKNNLTASDSINGNNRGNITENPLNTKTEQSKLNGNSRLDINITKDSPNKTEINSNKNNSNSHLPIHFKNNKGDKE